MIRQIPQKRRVRRGGKKNRAHGRNKLKCLIYRTSHRKEKSHVRRLRRHLRKFSGDRVAVAALERYEAMI